MSAIKNGVYTVTLKGKEYGLLFSLNALDEVQGRFGGYDKLGEIFNDKNPDLFKDTRWLLTLLINEWQLSEDENAQLIEEKRVGTLIHLGNLKEVQKAIYASFALATAGDGEEETPDVGDGGSDGDNEGNRQGVQES